jgi:hypothetical protein
VDVAVPRGRNAETENEDERADDGEEAAFARARPALTPALSRERKRGRVPSPACRRRWREAPDEGKSARYPFAFPFLA